MISDYEKRLEQVKRQHNERLLKQHIYGVLFSIIIGCFIIMAVKNHAREGKRSYQSAVEQTQEKLSRELGDVRHEYVCINGLMWVHFDEHMLPVKMDSMSYQRLQIECEVLTKANEKTQRI